VCATAPTTAAVFDIFFARAEDFARLLALIEPIDKGSVYKFPTKPTAMPPCARTSDGHLIAAPLSSRDALCSASQN
jgi:hypothetical protein